MTKDGKFELTHSLSAETEKRLAVRKKNIEVYMRGFRMGAAQLYGYAFLAGREMLMAKAELPHGNTTDENAGIKKWLETNFSEHTYRTSARWMIFAQGILEKGAKLAFVKKSLQLNAPKKKFSKDEQGEILKLVHDMMDGKGMMEFMRDCQLLRDAEKPTHTPPKPLSPEQKLAAEKKLAIDSWKAVVADQTLYRESIQHLDDETLMSVFATNASTAGLVVNAFARNKKVLADCLEIFVEISNKIRELQKGEKK